MIDASFEPAVDNRQAMKMNLNEAVVLVAGASGDIGRAIAFGLLGAGAEVFMLGRSMARLLQPLPPENVRAKCHFIVADLTDSSAVTRITADISPKGRLDVLVLSSGIYERSHEPAAFARQMAANVVGPYCLIQHLFSRPPFLTDNRQTV